MYKEIVDTDFEWTNFSLKEQAKILAADRSNNFLETTKLESFFPNVKNIKESVREMLIQYKNYDFPRKPSTYFPARTKKGNTTKRNQEVEFPM